VKLFVAQSDAGVDARGRTAGTNGRKLSSQRRARSGLMRVAAGAQVRASL
jgi:hypothetical protein